jgi:tetrahydromethanopterin S-methyltransferase subunit C
MADDLIPNQIIILVSVITCILCIYASDIYIVGGVLSIVAAVLSTVLGTNTLRKVGKYSLGTGVPSIVYLLAAIALVSIIVGVLTSLYFNLPVIFPIVSVIVATVISGMVSLICRYIFGIQVEVLAKSFILLALSSMFLIIAFSTLTAQTWNPEMLYESVIQNALIVFFMIIAVMVIQNPYNSCMGPNEDQYRTLSLACSNVFLMLIVVSICSMLNTEYWFIYMFISLIGWFIFFRQYMIYSKHQAASVRRYGLWPVDDGDD